MQQIIIYQVSNYWVIEQDGKISDKMSWDEMIGLLSQMTMPEGRPLLQWLKPKTETTA